MLIVLPKKFFTLDDGSSLFDLCFNNLLQMHYRNSHFLYIESPKEGLKYLKDARLDGWNLQIFKNICNQSRTVSRIFESIPYYVKISSFRGRSIQDSLYCKNIIEKPLEFYKDYETTDKIVLLCENIIDCKIYEYYFNIYFSYIEDTKEFTLSFDKRHGGGTTSDKIFDDLVNDKKNIICIKDSDCSTIEKIPRSSFNVKDIPFTIIFYINCHEIENTIPCCVLHEIIPNLTICEKFYRLIKYSSDNNEKFHHFFDYKNGITPKWLASLPSLYAKNLNSFFEKLDIDINFKNYDNDSNMLIHGFGEKLLELYEKFLQYISKGKLKEIYKKDFFEIFFPNLLKHVVAMSIASKKYYCYPV